MNRPYVLRTFHPWLSGGPVPEPQRVEFSTWTEAVAGYNRIVNGFKFHIYRPYFVEVQLYGFTGEPLGAPYRYDETELMYGNGLHDDTWMLFKEV